MSIKQNILIKNFKATESFLRKHSIQYILSFLTNVFFRSLVKAQPLFANHSKAKGKFVDYNILYLKCK